MFQTNIQFRGFESSPVNGEAQGLAVYENGVRINELFGDVVNYDFLPSVAINTMNVVTNNPVFGLNALAGAIVIDMKNGFNYQGAEVTATGGSFGRAQGSVQVGVKSGNWGAYFGGERISDDGYRDFSEFADQAHVRRSRLQELDRRPSFHRDRRQQYGRRHRGSPGAALGLDWARTFTSPQITNSKMIMPAFNGTVKVTQDTSISGVAYYRNYKQNHIDGNISEAEECEETDDLGFLCLEGEPLFYAGTDKMIPDRRDPRRQADRLDRQDWPGGQ